MYQIAVASGEHYRNCMRDTLYVPFEHSGNCLAAVRLYKQLMVHEACGESEWGICGQIKEEYDESFVLHWRAVGKSLYTYGPPAEFPDFNEKPDNRRGGVLGYYDIELLEQAFENCLAKEKVSREIGMRTPFDSTEAEFILAISMTSPLQEGQLCIREGYEDPVEEVG